MGPLDYLAAAVDSLNTATDLTIGEGDPMPMTARGMLCALIAIGMSLEAGNRQPIEDYAE